MASPVILRRHNPSKLSPPHGTGGPPSVTPPNSPHGMRSIISSQLHQSLNSVSTTSTATGTWGTTRQLHIPLIFTVSGGPYLMDKSD